MFVVDAICSGDLDADEPSPAVADQVVVGVNLLSENHKNPWGSSDRLHLEGAVNPGTQFSLAIELLERAVSSDHTIAMGFATQNRPRLVVETSGNNQRPAGVPPRLGQRDVSLFRVLDDVDDISEIDHISVNPFFLGPMVGVPA